MYASLTKRTSDLRFPPRYCLGSILFGFLRRVVRLFVPMFRRNALFSSSGLWVNSRPYPEDEGGSILRNTGKQLPNHMTQQPEDLLPQSENRFAKNDTSQRYAISSGQSGKSTATLALYFAAVFFLSVFLLLTQATRLDVTIVAIRTLKWTLWRKLCLARTHARTHARFSKGRFCSEYSSAVAFWHMSCTGCILHKAIIFGEKLQAHYFWKEDVVFSVSVV
jgi:hypothetical protein